MVAFPESVALEDVPAEVQIELLTDTQLEKRSVEFVLWSVGNKLKDLLGRDPSIDEVRDTLKPIHERLSRSCVVALSGDIQQSLHRALHGSEEASSSDASQTNGLGPSTSPETTGSADRIGQMLTPAFCGRLRNFVRHAMLIRYLVLEYKKCFKAKPEIADIRQTVVRLKEDGYASEACRSFFADDDADQKITNMIEHGSTNPAAAKAQGLRSAGSDGYSALSALDLDDEDEDGDSNEDGYEDGEFCEFEDIDFEALGIDPTSPTQAKPGSEEKVLMLAARYWSGQPLWHPRDAQDHQSSEAVRRVMGKKGIGGKMLDFEGGREKRI